LISANWAGEPLDSYETLLNHLQATTSTTGFCCQAHLDTTDYELNQKVPDLIFANLRIRKHQRFPQWNYTIYPRPPILLLNCPSYFFIGTNYSPLGSPVYALAHILEKFKVGLGQILLTAGVATAKGPR
jgi:hypothetical protein